MKVTYYALRTIQTGAGVRYAGDLIPEARDWPVLSGYIMEGKIAPVLVATLPEEMQELLEQWERVQNGEEPLPPSTDEDEQDEEPADDEQDDDEPADKPATPRKNAGKKE